MIRILSVSAWYLPDTDSDIILSKKSDLDPNIDMNFHIHTDSDIILSKKSDLDPNIDMNFQIQIQQIRIRIIGLTTLLYTGINMFNFKMLQQIVIFIEEESAYD